MIGGLDNIKKRLQYMKKSYNMKMVRLEERKKKL